MSVCVYMFVYVYTSCTCLYVIIPHTRTHPGYTMQCRVVIKTISLLRLHSQQRVRLRCRRTSRRRRGARNLLPFYWIPSSSQSRLTDIIRVLAFFHSFVSYFQCTMIRSVPFGRGYQATPAEDPTRAANNLFGSALSLSLSRSHVLPFLMAIFLHLKKEHLSAMIWHAARRRAPRFNSTHGRRRSN